MRPLLFSLLAIAALSAAPGKQTFSGVITDSMCARGDHSKMQMGPTDAECTIACIREHGATYVLYDGKAAYDLSDQQTPEKFAGKKVTITGTLATKTQTIQVDSIAAAK
jgi:type 1 fimbria pilin